MKEKTWFVTSNSKSETYINKKTILFNYRTNFNLIESRERGHMTHRPNIYLRSKFMGQGLVYIYVTIYMNFIRLTIGKSIYFILYFIHITKTRSENCFFFFIFKSSQRVFVQQHIHMYITSSCTFFFFINFYCYC